MKNICRQGFKLKIRRVYIVAVLLEAVLLIVVGILWNMDSKEEDVRALKSLYSIENERLFNSDDLAYLIRSESTVSGLLLGYRDLRLYLEFDRTTEVTEDVGLSTVHEIDCADDCSNVIRRYILYVCARDEALVSDSLEDQVSALEKMLIFIPTSWRYDLYITLVVRSSAISFVCTFITVCLLSAVCVGVFMDIIKKSKELRSS